MLVILFQQFWEQRPWSPQGWKYDKPNTDELSVFKCWPRALGESLITANITEFTDVELTVLMLHV